MMTDGTTRPGAAPCLPPLQLQRSDSQLQCSHSQLQFNELQLTSHSSQVHCGHFMPSTQESSSLQLSCRLFVFLPYSYNAVTYSYDAVAYRCNSKWLTGTPSSSGSYRTWLMMKIYVGELRTPLLARTAGCASLLAAHWPPAAV